MYTALRIRLKSEMPTYEIETTEIHAWVAKNFNQKRENDQDKRDMT